MSVRRTDAFIADVERQFDWYVLNANPEIAEQYLDAVKTTVRLLEQHPQIGPPGGFFHPRLRDWRFFLIFRPFKKHVLFYEIDGHDLIMRRVMHGSRDLPKRLLET
jgi:plasmid stabilization system protein ParE